MKKIFTLELKPGSQEELLPDFEENFPHIASHVVFGDGYNAPWHWHKAVELFYIESGAMEYSTPSFRQVFPAGSGGLLNSNVLHMTRGNAGKDTGANYIHLFDPVLIAGMPGSRIEENYVLPLTMASQVEWIPLSQENPKEREILRKLKASFALSAQTPGYELRIREALSEIWLEILELVAPMLEQRGARASTSELTKQMMFYIHAHYGEKLSVSRIAEAACVSERACFEMFRKNLRTTPMEYLNSYRLRKACQFLTQTEKTVTEISGECGMNNSYFCQVFRQSTGFTPLEYRRFYQRHQQSMGQLIPE